MAKILSFRNKEETSAGQTYLTDEAEKLSFHTGEDGAVSLDDVTNLPLPLETLYADPKKDWSNQELADLFRVRRLLSGANVAVETMRGVTDEGDPWFVFCHFNGDVFIHMARIDGMYVLDSPNVRRPLRGADFNGLIADFTDDALPSYTAADDGDDDTERRVIRLERGGKVRLHPSAMLAALIWTLFLASEELVMMAPEERADGSDDLLDFTDIIAADAEFAALETPDAATETLTQADSFKIDHADTIQTAGPEAQGQMRDAMGQQGLAMQQNAYAMGLSTIAIALGFMSEAVLMDNQRKVLEGLKSLGVTQADADTTNNPELEQIAGTSSDALMEKLAEFLGLDLSLNTDVADAVTPAAEDSLLQQEVLHVSTTAQDDMSAAVSTLAIQTIAEGNDDADMIDTPAELSEASYDADTLILIAATQQQETIGASMADIINGKLQMEEFQLGDTTVMASFDMSGSAALSDFLFMGRNTDHRTFDAQAQAFIDFIQAKETEVGVVTFGNEIIMIDRGAFRVDGAETYSFSWETYDGQVISMIGLRSEFQEFDLIA